MLNSLQNASIKVACPCSDNRLFPIAIGSFRHSWSVIRYLALKNMFRHEHIFCSKIHIPSNHLHDRSSTLLSTSNQKWRDSLSKTVLLLSGKVSKNWGESLDEISSPILRMDNIYKLAIQICIAVMQLLVVYSNYKAFLGLSSFFFVIPLAVQGNDTILSWMR